MVIHKVNNAIKLGALAATAAIFAASANSFADTITFNFNNPIGTLGTSQSYTATNSDTAGVTPTISAYGYSISHAITSPASLYGKNDSGSERGVGFAAMPDHEIDNLTQGGTAYNGFIQLDLTNLLPLAVTGNPTISLGSVTGPDAGMLSVSNTAGQVGSPITQLGATSSGLTSATIPWADFSVNDHFLTVSATNGSVLLDSMQLAFSPSTAAPEPASIALLAAAGAMLLLFRRKAARSAT